MAGPRAHGPPHGAGPLRRAAGGIRRWVRGRLAAVPRVRHAVRCHERVQARVKDVVARRVEQAPAIDTIVENSRRAARLRRPSRWFHTLISAGIDGLGGLLVWALAGIAGAVL